MSEQSSSDFSDREIDQIDLAYRQALQYGQDMVALYKQERQKRAALELAYKKLEAAFDGMNDGFIVTDKQLTILEVNHGCADMFEFAPEEATGKPLSDLLIGVEVQYLLDRLHDVKPIKLSTRLTLALPVTRTVTVQAVPLPDAGWALVLHDVTWEQRVNNMREEFLNLAAHELRTPLASIIGFTALLEQIADKHNLDAEVKAILNSILKSSEKLRHIVGDLVDATQNTSQEVEIESIDLHEIVQETLTVFTPLAEQKNIAVQVLLPLSPMVVLGHRQMLQAAITQLIENGIQHNISGGKLLIESITNGNSYTLVFTDTGKGITRKNLDYVLQPFFQAENHQIRHAEGLGLGLFIAQRTITMHGGSLNVSSQLGEGSQFSVTLPRFTAENMDAARQEWLAIRRRLNQNAQKTEDQPQVQMIIQRLKQQLEVTQSQNLAYARDLAKLYQLQRAETHENQQKKAQLSHTDRLALMGQLAAGVAHDLSNLISPILGYSQIILRRRDSIDPTMVDIIERILKTSRRANILLRQMVTLSKTQSTRESFDLNDTIKEMLDILESRIKQANIDLTQIYAEEKCRIYGSSIQISQVILNIVLNAIDAMLAGGVLTIKTSFCTPENEFILLQISDTGQGIAPEHLPHIFEAFFTTKEEKSGTGLGLSVTKQIIEDHQGRIQVDSVLGKGTTFSVFLPVQTKDEVDDSYESSQ